MVSVAGMPAVLVECEAGIIIGRANRRSHMLKHCHHYFSNTTRIKILFTDPSFSLLRTLSSR